MSTEKYDRKVVLEKLREYDERFQEFQKRIKEHEQRHPSTFKPPIGFTVVADAFTSVFESLMANSIELNIYDISKIWSQMFDERNIIYLRATSLIPANIWNLGYMARYEAGQRENIKHIEGLDRKERTKYESLAKDVLAKCKALWLGGPNFERTFIIRDAQLSDHEALVDLIDVIWSQSEYIDVRICYEGVLPVKHRWDFGLAVSKEGEAWLYELGIIGEDLLYGGKITANEQQIREMFQIYGSIQSQAEPIPRQSTIESITNTIAKVSRRQLDLDTLKRIRNDKAARTGGNKCLACFVESEETIRGGNWHNFPEERKVWYDMFVAENDAVRTYVQNHKPQRIIEVGCGPGRFIDLLKQFGLDNFQTIVGIDLDSQMRDRAYRRFGDYFPKIQILKMEVNTAVKSYLPYREDDFDFCINAMNIVGWQENAKEWLREMLRCSKCVFFTVFKRGYEDLRMRMYKERRHEISARGVHRNLDGEIVLGDCAVLPCVKSRSYTNEDIHDLCKTIADAYSDCAYKVDERSNRLLYLCFIYKRNFIPNLFL